MSKPTGLELTLHRLRVSSISLADVKKTKNVSLANMLNLRHAIEILQELLRTSGVGALPLLNLQQHPAPQLPSEEQLLADTTNATQQLFERLKNLQESSTIVTNLLSIPDQQRK